ncbi:MAG TPA: hypothetical protein VF552_05485 [Allosphingosinicella sp.]|jgi:hypothetical protein
MSDLPAGDEPDAETFEDYAPSTEDEGYTTAEFHNVVQKQIVNATYETLIENKLHWELVEPFLRAARDVCRGDFRRTGRIEVHGVVAEGEGWADAEEAYLSLSVADQDDGREWLSETWWLSDLILAAPDPRQVREAARALERSVARLDAWLAENDAGGEAAGDEGTPAS